MTIKKVFEMQNKLNQRSNDDWPPVTEEQRQEWMFKYLTALDQEKAELIDSLPWKWWKKQDANWDNVKIELVDILHFFVSMCMIAGMDADELLELYFKKNELNFKRQDEGYREGTYQKVVDGVEDNERLHGQDSRVSILNFNGAKPLALKFDIVDRSSFQPGPWDGEPDLLAWEDPDTGFICEIHRNKTFGHLCGYVGVGKQHVLYGVDYDLDVYHDLDIHGGCTFSEKKSYFYDKELWYIGFDALHSDDYAPISTSHFSGIDKDCSYKDIGYMINEVRRLASQLSEV